MSKIVRLPNGEKLDDLPTTRIPAAARRQVIAMADRKSLSDDLPTTRIPASMRRQVIATVHGKRPSLEPPVALRKRTSVLDSAHLENASDSESGLRAAPERTESRGTVLSVSEAPKPSEAPTLPPPPRRPALPHACSDVLPGISGDELSLESGDELSLESGDELSLESGDELSLDGGDELSLESGDELSLESADVISLSSPEVLPSVIVDVPPDASREEITSVSASVLPGVSPFVLPDAIPDRSGSRLAIIICFLAMCAIGVLAIAAKSSPSSSHQPRHHGLGAFHK